MRSAATGAVLPLLRVAARAGEGAAGARGVLVPVSAPAVRALLRRVACCCASAFLCSAWRGEGGGRLGRGCDCDLELVLDLECELLLIILNVSSLNQSS